MRLLSTKSSAMQPDGRMLKKKRRYRFIRDSKIELERHLRSGQTPVHVMGSSDYDCIRPILLLIDLQERKKYVSLNEPALKCVWGDIARDVISLKLTGTDVNIVVRDSTGEHVLVALDATNDAAGARFRFVEGICHLIGEVKLVAIDPEIPSQLERSIALLEFEKWSLYKSLTAALVSVVGIRIPDIHMILGSSYAFADWCNIFIDGVWVKVWVHIDTKGKPLLKTIGKSIKFFTNNKHLTEGNLLCYIQNGGFAEEAFFVQDPITISDSPTLKVDEFDRFLWHLNTIKYIGNVKWQPRSSRISSRGSSVRSSVSSKPSFSSSFSFGLGRKRSSVTPSSTSLFEQFEPGQDYRIEPGLLIKPVPHSGIHHLESMIRFLVPTLDCLQLYGRPQAFIHDYNDPASLLFGLPKLPVIDYFAQEELALLESQPLGQQQHWQQLKYFLGLHIGNLRRSELQFNTVDTMEDLESKLFTLGSETKLLV